MHNSTLMRNTITAVILVWASVALGFALMALGSVNDDARLLATAASVLGSLAAVVGAWAYLARRNKLAIILLVVSAVTPTYAAWALSLIPLAIATAIFATTRQNRVSLFDRR